MQIGIDGFEANVEKRVGIGQYAFELLKELAISDTENQYTVFLPSFPLSDMPKITSKWKYVIGKPGSLWTIRQLPFLINQQKLDLFFSPTHYLPWFVNMPKIMSIMDLSYLHYPKMFKTKDLIQLKYLTHYSIKRAQKILTISEHTRNEIFEQYKYPKKDIIVTYPGVNEIYRKKISNEEIQKIRSKYLLNKPYFLFVGTVQPRKNIINLIKAFELVKEDVLFIIVGKKGWMHKEIFATHEISSKKKNILFLDYVQNDDMPALYKGAIALVLPSLYEGFGIPVIEAMNCHCPVIVSKNSSLPEVAGKAGTYIDPLDIVDIANQITNTLKLNQENRQKIIIEGTKQAKKFTWQNCAQKTIEVFFNLK